MSPDKRWQGNAYPLHIAVDANHSPGGTTILCDLLTCMPARQSSLDCSDGEWTSDVTSALSPSFLDHASEVLSHTHRVSLLLMDIKNYLCFSVVKYYNIVVAHIINIIIFNLCL